MQIPQALERFLVQLAADGRSGHTIGQYRRHVRLFAAWLADVGHTGDVGAIDHIILAQFLGAPRARTSAHGGAKRATSVNCLRSSLRGFFAYLHQAGEIAQNPARLVRRAVTGQAPPRTLSAAERAKLLAALDVIEGPEDARDRVLFRMILSTGVRLSAAVALDIEDVDLERGELRLRSMKGDRPATAILPESTCDELREFIGDRTEGPLFLARHGGRVCVRHVQRRFRKLVERAGIKRPISPHGLRHTMATDLYRKTGDVFLVKEALHHRSLASTLVYARPDEARLRAALG